MNNVDFHSKNENHDLNKAKAESTNLERIYFRCPSCSKMYASDPAHIYVEEPEYTCSKCSTEFSISLLSALQNSEVVGVVKSTSKDPKPTPVSETVELPLVKKALLNEKSEVVDAVVSGVQQEFDFESLETGDVSFSDLVEENFTTNLELAWNDVLENYESRREHNDFIEFCRSEDSVEFAIEKYAALVKINSNDKIASSFLKKIEFRAESQAVFKNIEASKIFTKSFYITLAVVLGGLFIIGVGSLWFQNKNVAGLGIGLIFFTFAARAFFQPRHL